MKKVKIRLDNGIGTYFYLMGDEWGDWITDINAGDKYDRHEAERIVDELVDSGEDRNRLTLVEVD